MNHVVSRRARALDGDKNESCPTVSYLTQIRQMWCQKARAVNGDMGACANYRAGGGKKRWEGRWQIMTGARTKGEFIRLS